MTKNSSMKKAIMEDGVEIELTLTVTSTTDNVGLKQLELAIEEVKKMANEASKVAFAGYAANNAEDLLLECLQEKLT